MCTRSRSRSTGLDFDNGSEFLNQAVIKWAADRQIFFTRSRPYKKNDQATIESKNNHLVRQATATTTATTPPPSCGSSNRLWSLVNDRLNYLTPTKKPIGWDADRNGKRRRIYDKPTTPTDRLLGAGVLYRHKNKSSSITAHGSTRPTWPDGSTTSNRC